MTLGLSVNQNVRLDLPIGLSQNLNAWMPVLIPINKSND